MKNSLKHFFAGICCILLIVSLFASCTPDADDPLESAKDILDSLTDPPTETLTQAYTAINQTSGSQELVYKIPDEVATIFSTSFSDLFGGKDAEPIGSGEGSNYYQSDRYPNLQLHFDADIGLVSAIEGNIGYLVPGKDALTLAEFRQVFGSDSIVYSEEVGSYMASPVLENKYKLFCGYFDNDQEGTISRVTLMKGTS